MRSAFARRCTTHALLLAALLPVIACKARNAHDRRAKSSPNTDAYADTMAQLVHSQQLAILKWSNISDYQAEVQRFYDDRNYELAWTRDGKPTTQATGLIQLFTHADLKGLAPEDYDASRWPDRLAKISAIHDRHDTSADAHTLVAQFDAAMTISAMRYFSDLHVGRINPQALNFDIDVPTKRAQFNVVNFIDANVVDAPDVATVAQSAEPQNPMYRATEEALSRYIELARDGVQPHLPQVSDAVKVGGNYSALPLLLTRLQLEGDASTTQIPLTYNAALSAAVKHWQQRHGLTDDGRLTAATIDSLNVPLIQRVQQLSLTLERWRWLPDNYESPRVLVNLPEFQLRAFDADRNLAFKMRIVCGEAHGNHDTPMFVRLMRYVVFRPYWNVPPSIIKKELVPHIHRSGVGYLPDKGYEVVGKKNEPVTKYSASDIEHLRYSIRQPPGPKNSLGLVKFLFPNEYDVYMHSTPEMNLFNLTRRDRSHGCVRLQHADQMALWVMSNDQPDPLTQTRWDADKISEAMNGNGDPKLDNRTFNLKTPLPVVITYMTAMPDEDGSVHFYADIYGYDKELSAALAKGLPYDRSPHKIDPKLTPGETE